MTFSVKTPTKRLKAHKTTLSSRIKEHDRSVFGFSEHACCFLSHPPPCCAAQPARHFYLPAFCLENRGFLFGAGEGGVEGRGGEGRVSPQRHSSILVTVRSLILQPAFIYGHADQGLAVVASCRRSSLNLSDIGPARLIGASSDDASPVQDATHRGFGTSSESGECRVV